MHARESRGRSALRASVVLCLLALGSGSGSAHEAKRVSRFVVGHAASPAVCAGLDSSGSGRSPLPFPRQPEVTRRTRVSGGIGQAPISDAAGNLLIVHGEPRLSQLDEKGRSLWSERLPSEASCSPMLLGNGSIVVVTRDAEALYFSAAGKLLSKRGLPFSDPRRRVAAIPTASGGALVASGADLVQLDGSGQTVRQARATNNVASVAESGSELVAITENGTVLVARTSGDFEVVGNLGGQVTDGAVVQAGKVFAIVDAHRWLSLELRTGHVVSLANDPTSTLSGPPTLFGTRGAAFVADGGFISLRSVDGSESTRVPLNSAGQAFDAAQRGLRPALLVSDRTGVVAAVRGGGDAVVLDADGSAQRLENTTCLDPFRPTPTRGGLVLACRSGQLFTVSGKGP